MTLNHRVGGSIPPGFTNFCGTNMEFDDPKFKEEFWKWFDSLAPVEKRKFQEYKFDTAELFFYNRFYVHKVQSDINIKQDFKSV